MKFLVFFFCVSIIYQNVFGEEYQQRVENQDSRTSPERNKFNTIRITDGYSQETQENVEEKPTMTEENNRHMFNFGSVFGKLKPEVEEKSEDNYATPKSEKGHLNIPRETIKGIGKGISKISSGFSKGVDRIGKEISMSVESAKNFLGRKDSGGLDTEPSFVSKFFGKIGETVGDGAKKSGEAIKSLIPEVHSIFPGTLWCGGGNLSNDDKELGTFFATDVCCREHDMCSENMAAGETKYGLENNGLFTRSHCDCDDKFRECLEKSCTPICFSIGMTYFNVLGPQCYKEEFPIKGCSKWIQTESNLTKCAQYDLDRNSKPIWQWKDSPLFFCALPDIEEIKSRKPKSS